MQCVWSVFGQCLECVCSVLRVFGVCFDVFGGCLEFV